jgi:hypothetical protein
MTTMLKKLFGSPTITGTERDLLDTVRDSAIPSPEVLRERLAGLTQQIDAAEREWERLDRRGDAAAFLALTPIAERLQTLRVEAAALPAAIESAERRRSAFLALARMFDAVAAEVSARTCALLEHPPQDVRERDVQLRALDQATRIHGRLAGRLAAISTSPLFRDPADALGTLRADMEARLHELDRLRVPGMRRPLGWPEAMTALLDTIEGRERKTA